MQAERYFEGYPMFLIGCWSNCAYCGFESECRDHVWPVVMLTGMDRKLERNAVMQMGPQVLACSFCNSKLAARYFPDFQTRAEFMSRAWLKKAEKVSAEWGEAEKMKLAYSLRKFVEQKQEEKRSYELRSKWFDSAEFYENLNGLLAQETLLSYAPGFREDYYEFFKRTIELIRSSDAARQKRERQAKDDQRSGAG